MSAQEEPTIVELAERTTAVVRGTVPMGELPGFFDSSFGALGAVLAAQGVVPTGAAFALYRSAPTDVAELEVGFPTGTTVEATGPVEVGSLPGGRAVLAVHRGGFDELGDAWGRVMGFVAEQGLTASGPMWEVYVTEPSPEMDPADLITELYLPID